MGNDDRSAANDERAVLDQLEQLQQQIQEVRRKRREASEAFDSFLRTFEPSSAAPPRDPDRPPAHVRAQPRTTDMLGDRSRASAPPIVTPPVASAPRTRMEPVAAPAPPRPPAPPAVAPPVVASVPAAPERPQPVPAPASTDSVPTPLPDPFDPGPEPSWPEISAIPDAWRSDAEPETTAAALPRSDGPGRVLEESAEPAIVPMASPSPSATSGSRSPLVIALVVVLGAVVAFYAWRSGSPDTDAVSTGPETTAAVPPAQTTAPTAQPTPPPTPPPAPVPAAQITTARHVWLRVTVDGKQVLERELPADTTLPFEPTKQIVVRAGDAGAVRVSIAGADQGPVGPDGVAVTRGYPIKP